MLPKFIKFGAANASGIGHGQFEVRVSSPHPCQLLFGYAPFAVHLPVYQFMERNRTDGASMQAIEIDLAGDATISGRGLDLCRQRVGVEQELRHR